MQRNAFFAFSDNILAGMLADSREEIRQEAVEKILQIREEKESFDLDRRVPELNWSSDHFSKMIDWDSLSLAQLNEPSSTRGMSPEELKTRITNPLILNKWYCHTQCVERSVKLVSASAVHVYKKDDRHGAILAGVKSRAKRIKIETKDSYEVSNICALNVFIVIYTINNLLKEFKSQFF